MNARRLTLACLLSIAICTSGDCQTVTTLDDVEFWVGAGEQQALLTIDWNGETDADTALAWGYRWQDTATAETMFREILQADERLYAKLSTNIGFGIATYGIGYDHNDDGQFQLDDNTSFNSSGIAITGPSDLTEAVDPADLYVEGWDLGFWHIATTPQNPASGGTWMSSQFGVSGIALAEDMWVSLAFTTDTRSTTAVAENLMAAPSPYAPGDFQPDGVIDNLDLVIWQAGYARQGDATQQLGDADHDHDVDGADFLLWQRNYSPASTDLSINSTVPEPSSVALVSCGFVLFVSTFFPKPKTWSCFS